MIDGTEGISQDNTILLINEYGSLGISEYAEKFLVSIFLPYRSEEVGSPGVMDRQNLSEKPVHGIKIPRLRFTYYTHIKSVKCFQFQLVRKYENILILSYLRVLYKGNNRICSRIIK